MIIGEPKLGARTFLEVPNQMATQASWEFDTGLARLEGGTPEMAADHFARALALVPKMNLRPLIAYYLEKLGKPVPPVDPEEAEASAETAKAATNP